MTPHDYLRAAHVPLSLKPREFGLWTIKRLTAKSLKLDARQAMIWRGLIGGFDTQTVLYRLTQATLHQPPGDIVMEDSAQELSRHLPIWMAAHGRVLITGLGLGCVVRGLLANSRVVHIDVVEIDADILKYVGREFVGNPRVSLHYGDALTYDFGPGAKWDCAWHDLYVDEGSAFRLHVVHTQLLNDYRDRVAHQGAWQLPRWVKRFWREPLLGGQR